MATKKYLDKDGLYYYHGKLQKYIEGELNETLQEALNQFAGALVPRGTIDITDTNSIDLREGVYENATAGDLYFIGKREAEVSIIYVDTNGTVVTEKVETGDAVACIVSAEVNDQNVVISDAQWAILQTNWSVKNENVSISFGKESNTAVVAKVGGVNITLGMPSSYTIVEELKVDIENALNDKYLSTTATDQLDDVERQNVRTNLGLSELATMNKTDNIDNPSGNLIPTDLAVKNFVESKIGQSTSGVSDVQRFNNSTGEWLGVSVLKDGIARLPTIKMVEGTLTEYYPDMLGGTSSSIGSTVLFGTIDNSSIDSLF